MRLLVDTHALIWFATADPNLSSLASSAIADPDNQVYVSVISRWEIILLRRKHRGLTLHEDVEQLIDRAFFERLGLAFDVPGRLAELPMIHTDPFDRMLVAQALSHDLVLVTADSQIPLYPVRTLW